MVHFDPSEISNWADLPDASHQLPELIRRLILATVPDLSRLDMPGGSAVWLPGWDGVLTSETGNAWAPRGVSAWELSCRSDVRAKASDDYCKRTNVPEDVDVVTSTFVFVTSRQWAGKREWVEQRQSEGNWSEVRALDASDLAAWLQQAPAVAEWFGRLIGKLPADGYISLDEWWENWATASTPTISAELVLAGRRESVNSLAERVRQTPAPYYVQAHTREEAITFVAASALNSSDAWSAALMAKALVVKSEDAWNSLVRNTSPLVLIRAFDGNVSSQVATNRGHHAIAPLHEGDELNGNGVALPRLGRDETVTALTDMGLSENRSRALARKTARRLPVIRRFLIEEAGGPMPEWASVNARNPLSSLILVGQWDEDNEHDRTVVASVTGCRYEDVARELTTLALSEDSPLTKIGSRWRFVSHEEAWHILAPRLTTAEVARFQKAATMILGAESPKFEMPVDERYLANIQGKVVPHSGLVRHGIVRTLALMGNQGERAKNVEGLSYLPEGIVRRVLSDNGGWQIWATLDRNLATLVEAAPEAILSAIERQIAATPSPFGELFAQEGGPLFSGSSHTGLLWALERLAWSPEYFSRVANVLARLALIDPGGRISNRPAESLATMFLPWFRVSETSDTQRLETLEMLLNRSPEPGWRSLINSYPSHMGGFAIGREPPAWRPWAQDGPTSPTRAEIYAFVEGAERLLLEYVGEDAERWVDVIGVISRLSPDARRRVTHLMAQRIEVIKEHPHSQTLWAKLRKELNGHRSFPDAEWAMPAADLEPLAAIYQLLTPDDPGAAFSWLFDGKPDTPEGTDRSDVESYFAKIDAERQTAVSVIHGSGGLEAILSVAESAQQPEYVGRAFAIRFGREPALALAAAHTGSDNRGLRRMAHGILLTIMRQCSCMSLDYAITQVKAVNARPQALADVFLAAPPSQNTWQRLDQEKPEVQRCYWEQVNPFIVPRDDEGEIQFVAEQLLAVHRSPSLAEWLSSLPIHHEIVIRTLEQIPADLTAGVALDSASDGLIYDIVSLLGKLDEAHEVSDDAIAHLELPFLSALRSGGRPNLAIYRKIASDPALFADLIALTCKRDDGQPGAVPAQQEAHVSEELLARIIVGEGEIPGKSKDGTVEYKELVGWVNEARRLCDERKRAAIGDNVIGHLLAKSPVGEDQVWPCEAVRDLLDGIMSQHIGDGFISGAINLRGVTTRGAFEGGIQERTLADEYQEFAQKIASQWPHTAGLLRRIADSYRREAQRNDRQADELDQFGF